jgi:peptidoglycan/LPS O-acetylase OafA/YrhL
MTRGFLNRFRRVTYSTSYLPEIDGLRFLAIFSVVVIMHITGYMNEKFYNDQFVAQGYWQRMVLGGGGGVSLFFIISGFILSLPFAKWRLNDEKPVLLKNYYLRRLTRLEPPYIIALLIFFIVHVWILRHYSFDALLPRFFYSASYLHTIKYDSFSPILPVAWSLEVEVQFYLAAPLLFTLFLIPSRALRWVICIMVIITGSIFWFNTWTKPHLFKFLHFFFCGILLADMYCSGVTLVKKQKPGAFLGIAALLGFIFIPSVDYLPGYLLRIVCMFWLFHSVLMNPIMKKLFSLKMMVIIGGMCYSIYLLHFAIVSFAGSVLLRSTTVVRNQGYFLLFYVAFTVFVLLVSSVFFLCVEKPFMRPFGLKGKNKDAK